jgi:membrane associated rhomboid family serine protease/tetratricopeptide (TPR) repeat protein
VLIPIGHEDQQVARLPWVTILLVVANVVVFLFTNQMADQRMAETRDRVREIVRYANEHPYLRIPPGIQAAVRPALPQPELDADAIAEQQTRLDTMWSEVSAAVERSVFRQFGYTPAAPSPLTLFTSMFLHGGWLHLLGNLLFLWLAGGSLEDRWGRVFYAMFYVASGVVAAVSHGAMNAQSSVPMVGASGAIAGLMGAFLIRLGATRIRFFYWFLFVRGTFVMPAFVALPLWLLDQFVMARFGAAGIAVWAHIGGFAFGVLSALVVQLTNLETNVLAPAIAKKTVWSPSEQLTTALAKLDRGHVKAGIQDLVAFLKRSPNSIEARAALVGAYTQKGDSASAGRESARLVSAYVVARDLEGGMAALEAHQRAHSGVPVPLRSLLTLAAYREKDERFREAADLYHKAIEAWPDDPLVSKARIAYGRVMLEVFKQPDDALAILEGALTGSQTTPEFRRAAEELIAAAKRARPGRAEHGTPAPPTADAEPRSLAATASDGFPQEPADFAVAAPTAREVELARLPAGAEQTPEPHAEFSSPENLPSAPAPDVTETRPANSLDDALSEPAPTWRLSPVSLRAVGIDARGLRLENRDGKMGLLAWESVVGISVARIDDPGNPGQSGDGVFLDLLMAPKTTPDGKTVRCVRLTGAELSIPQLQTEPSSVRRFQRLVATVLKTSKATPYPSREDCLGARGFPTFSDLGAYENALLAYLRLALA